MCKMLSTSVFPNVQKCKRTPSAPKPEMKNPASVRCILTCFNLFNDSCSRCLFCLVAGARVPDVTRFIFIRLSSLVSYTFLIVSENLSAYMSREMSAAFPKNRSDVSPFALCSRASFLSGCLRHAGNTEKHFLLYLPNLSNPDCNPVRFIIVLYRSVILEIKSDLINACVK